MPPETITYARINSFISDASDGTEDGLLHLKHIVAGTEVAALRLDASEYVFNDSSLDVDFRVESNGNTHMLFVDAGNDHVNIGTATDLGGVFNVFGTGAGNAKVVIEGEGGADPSLNFLANNTTHFIVGIDDSDSDKFKISQHSAFGTNDFFTIDTDGGATITRSDNGAQLVLKCTDADANRGPILDLLRDGGSPADSDFLGQIRFTADDDGGNLHEYAKILSQIADVTGGTEDGILAFRTVLAGTDTRRIDLGATETVINEDSADLDFRVESDNSTHAFIVDGGNGGAGFGTSLNSDLHGSATNILLGRAGSLYAERSSALGIPVTAIGYNFYIDSDTGNYGARITSAGTNFAMGAGTFSFNTAASVSANAAITYVSRMNISESSVVINESGADNDFRIESDNKANMFGINAGSDFVYIGADEQVQNGDLSMNAVSASPVIGMMSRSTGSGDQATILLQQTNATSGNFTATSDGRGLGLIGFRGVDSAGVAREGGGIRVEQSGAAVSGAVNGQMTFRTRDVDRMVIDSGGTVTLKSSAIRVPDGSAAAPSFTFENDTNSGIFSPSADNLGFSVGGNQKAFLSASQFNVTGNGVFSGSISKGSGSFKIDHPLPAKTDTHHLVHSFVEAPQADNIYRGSVDLVGGSATVNIDTAAGMTDGTFVLLNTNVQCFTSNESGWTAIKGSVSGNTLTITAQDNSCTDTISWMVVGERHDQHMKDTEWTDSDGKVIVEPRKNF
jgi:hypothetical protein